MIVTYNWLKEFVDFDLSPENLAGLLTMLGLEVEGMHSLGSGMDGVVVALVEEKIQHPNADKLSVCKVNNGKEILTIICGAQNFKAGDKVALAQLGTVLPGDFKIKRSKIRGIESFGMLCSEKELGLSDESAGIMILPNDSPLGDPLFAVLGLRDTIFEIGLTPNRADCLSVRGIAREIAAKLATRLKDPGHEVVASHTPVEELVSVKIDDPALCSRYTARFIADCKIGPSPGWLVSRLKAVGMRSINNVVDVTNYVLMEFGHPLHAFDFDLLSERKIVVRRATEGEMCKTLDGQERQLKSSDLTIRDGEKIVALAGIMGGENSEINANTTNILLESAYFSPVAIRRTAKRLGIHTESSHRFERGADINVLVKALDRAAHLIAELAGGKVAKGVIDVYPNEIEPSTINFRIAKANQILGIKYSTEEVRQIFHNLGFTSEYPEPGVLQVSVPTFRVDLEREIDLIEEVARLNGYDKIPATMPKVHIFSDRPSHHQRLEKRLRDLLVAQGLSEVINYSFVAPSSLDKVLLSVDDYRRNNIKIMNPLNEEQSVMRTTLLPGLLETAARNFSFRLLNQQIFEMRRVYLPRIDGELPEEPLYIAGILSGSRNPESWNQYKDKVDFFDAKGIVENIFEMLNIPEISYKNKDIENFYHPGKACTLYHNGVALGSLGELHPEIQDHYGLEQNAFYFEINFEKLMAIGTEAITVRTPSRFPDTFRDIAILVSDETEAGAILEAIKSTRLKEMEGVELFDQYKGTNIPSGQKSLAFRIRYRSYEKTLTDDEVNIMHKRVIENLRNKLNVIIR
jgi:phenylalanyl-tRNA synthetase beta chain